MADKPGKYETKAYYWRLKGDFCRYGANCVIKIDEIKSTSGTHSRSGSAVRSKSVTSARTSVAPISPVTEEAEEVEVESQLDVDVTLDEKIFELNSASEHHKDMAVFCLNQAYKIATGFLHPLAKERLEAVLSQSIALFTISNERHSAMYNTEQAIADAYLTLDDVKGEMVTIAKPILEKLRVNLQQWKVIDERETGSDNPLICFTDM